MWPDLAIYWTLGNYSKPLATINLPKCPTFLGNFCTCVKIFNFYSEIILDNFYRHLASFYWSHCPRVTFITLFQAIFSIEELESAALAVCQYLASAAAAKRANLGSPITTSLHEAAIRYLTNALHNYFISKWLNYWAISGLFFFIFVFSI